MQHTPLIIAGTIAFAAVLYFGLSRGFDWVARAVDRRHARRVGQILADFERKYGKPYPWDETMRRFETQGIDVAGLNRLKSLWDRMKNEAQA